MMGMTMTTITTTAINREMAITRGAATIQGIVINQEPAIIREMAAVQET